MYFIIKRLEKVSINGIFILIISDNLNLLKMCFTGGANGNFITDGNQCHCYYFISGFNIS